MSSKDESTREAFKKKSSIEKVEEEQELKKFYMEFEQAQNADEEFHMRQIRINRISKVFWKRMADMITGPDHEYVYLRRLIKRINDRENKKKQQLQENYNLNQKQCKKLQRKYLAGKGILPVS